MLKENSKNINLDQKKAVYHQGSNLLILAGPGTGKTHTLAYRISEIHKKLQDGQNILAVTFTNKAAEEMEDRLMNKFACNKSRIFVGTFHSFCLNLLITYFQYTKLPYDFTIISPDDAEVLIKELWPKKTIRERKQLLNEISKEKATDCDLKLSQQIEDYNKFLKGKGYLDFDDILLEAVNLLNNDLEALRNVRKTYPYVFVDEYQDINYLQYKLLKTIIHDEVSITAIGDPNQAIYGFRGSNVRYFEEFPNDFKGAQILTLNKNYRSTSEILKASGQVIAKSEFAVPELTADIYSKGLLTIYRAETDKAEAEYVVHNIEKKVGGTSMFSQDSSRVKSHEDANYSFGDIAVLYRLNFQRKILEQALSRSGIPYQVSGDKAQYTDYSLAHKAEKVNLLTMHASKGLEFPVVFIVGCEDNIIPLNLEDFKTKEEEERRLFYVAMTRAKNELYFVSAKKRMIFGKSYNNGPSLFLKDIEEKLKEYDRHENKYPKRKVKSKQIKLFD